MHQDLRHTHWCSAGDRPFFLSLVVVQIPLLRPRINQFPIRRHPLQPTRRRGTESESLHENSRQVGEVFQIAVFVTRRVREVELRELGA